MIKAILSSISHVGYLFPVAIIRIVLGYIFFQRGLQKLSDHYLQHPKLAAAITEWIPQSAAPVWYLDILESFIVPNWKIFTYVMIGSELVIGISFILGFLVRPASILGGLYSIHFIYSHAQPSIDLYQSYLMLFILTLMLGAGRCIGVDYFFYKRNRRIIW